jgi:hypothetical protein
MPNQAVSSASLNYLSRPRLGEGSSVDRSFVSDGGNHSSFVIFTVCFFGMKPNIDNKGRAARGGIAAIFLLAGGTLIQETPVLALIFILVGLFCAFEAWQAWCAIRACGFKLPF